MWLFVDLFTACLRDGGLGTEPTRLPRAAVGWGHDETINEDYFADEGDPRLTVGSA
jgi:hypothetical protein